METCKHGIEISKEGRITCFDCEAEDMPDVGAPGAEGPTCHHGTYYEQVECEQCADEEECGGEENDMPMICEHGIEEDDCAECGAKFDRMADAHRAQQDWNHFHPAED